MAQKSNRQRFSLLKKVAVVGLALTIFQVVLIVHFQNSTRPVSIREEISRQVEKTPGISAQRRELLRLQLAINDFRIAGGQLPKNLDELRPKYFDKVPIDPDTGAAFKYTLTGNNYVLGDTEKKQAQKAAAEQGGADASVDEQAILIASLDIGGASPDSFVYDPTGKREPFRPFDLSPKVEPDDARAPLEHYDIGQLKLTAVLNDPESPAATVENQARRGFIVKKGTKIGVNGGEVVEILSDRIKILETLTDFTGAKKTNVIEMVLRTKDLDGNGIRKQQRP